ncbi:hypothetical protein [Rhizobium skierniewicense]|uniref:hypothetical protein n=1 Tax=Rhizobium skierniewicense TaxID=984260 RepID=UPI0015718297|nr:hypothetical protein [Rhizobium skierniewicense]NTF34269.1 hypothetical protein [Rhizobium skierniewicense]
MIYRDELKWPDIVYTACQRLDWDSFIVKCETHQNLDRHIAEVRNLSNGVQLPNFIRFNEFENYWLAVGDNSKEVYIFEQDASSADEATFRRWIGDYTFGRIVRVELDGTHGSNIIYAAMFRDEPNAIKDAIQFKLKECNAPTGTV